MTGVDSARKLELIRSLGADQAIDYRQEDFTRREERYDLIFDVASNLSLADCGRVLEPGGTHILIGHDHFGDATGRLLGSIPRVLGYLALSPFLGQLKNPDPEAAIPTMGEAMELLRQMLDSGALTPIIDRTYPLEETSEAMRYLQRGEALGRIIVTP